MMFKQRAVGTFSSYEDTEIALQELKEKNFFMDQISVIGRNLDSSMEVTGVNTNDQLDDISNLRTDKNKAGETATDGAMAGITLGGFTGLLVGLGAIAIPGVGPVILAGAAATALVTTLSGGVIGGAIGSLGGGLVGLGIPADQATVYSDLIAHGNYLVIVEGSNSDIILAESIFSKHDINNWYIYDLPSESVPTVKPIQVHPTRV